ncbi:MAG TPA: molybdenum cofactor biosynthesis protein MoaE, partial [Allosphingosinicella sp.]|nr:molybdenum cofactor biosynthesis protein MoaE [Allosphingosinicella sp.]
MSAETRLAPDPFRPDEELAHFIAGLGGDGAVVSFTGLARPQSAGGEKLTSLFLDAYPGMTEA